MAKFAGSLSPDIDPFTDPKLKDSEGHLDFDLMQKANAEWLEALKEEFRQKNRGDLVGEELRWQRADGYARYIVTKQSPLTLAHLEIDDAWSVESALIRGLRVKDVRDMLEAEKRLNAMFSKTAS